MYSFKSQTKTIDMLKAKILCLLLPLLMPVLLTAQTKTIRGRVVSTEGKPLSGATVTLKNGGSSTFSAADGSYALAVPVSGDAAILVSFIGYESSETSASKASGGDIVLKESSLGMDEVVVVGYGTQRKRDVTGAVASLSKERLQQLPNTNVAQALQGSVPGLQINTNGGGAEGNNLSILIRGRNSISASNGPLIIWDGIPYEGGISEINPNDVESIEVLKDASAAAIYGSRGSNGVILITSKQGKKGRLNVTYDVFTARNRSRTSPTC